MRASVFIPGYVQAVNEMDAIRSAQSEFCTLLTTQILVFPNVYVIFGLAPGLGASKNQDSR
jgi:hypothetical protein